jgi:hypothetical protein
MNVRCLGIPVDLRMAVFTPGVRQPSAVVLGRSSRPTGGGHEQPRLILWLPCESSLK